MDYSRQGEQLRELFPMSYSGCDEPTSFPSDPALSISQQMQTEQDVTNV